MLTLALVLTGWCLLSVPVGLLLGALIGDRDAAARPLHVVGAGPLDRHVA